MQPDAATGPRQPFLHQLGVMIARVVEKDMDEHQQRIERFDRFQQPDRRGGVDGLDVDHPGLPALEIDRAVNIDAVAPAGYDLLHSESHRENHGPAEFINPQNARNFANSSMSWSCIYAEVVADGRIADGDTLQVTDV